MKKILLIATLVCSLNACSTYKPVVDTVGRSGTFDESRAERISDDIILCQELAKTTTMRQFNYTTICSMSRFILLLIL